MINYPSGSVDLLIDGNSVLQGDLQWQGTEIYYAYHEIPRMSVNLFGYSFDDVVTKSDFRFKYTAPNGDNYDIPFYVKQIDHAGDISKLIGFTCTTDFMKTAKTQYLGDNLKKAISNCCGELKTDKIYKVNASGKFYQINETDYQALLRLMRGCSADYNWAITESELVLINPNDKVDLVVDKVQPLRHGAIATDESEPVIDDSFKEDFYTQGWYRNQYVESSSPEYVQNLLSAASKMQSYENMLPVKYDEFISMPVGQKVKIDVETYRLTECEVIGKTVKINQQSVETELVLGVNNG